MRKQKRIDKEYLAKCIVAGIEQDTPAGFTLQPFLQESIEQTLDNFEFLNGVIYNNE